MKKMNRGGLKAWLGIILVLVLAFSIGAGGLVLAAQKSSFQDVPSNHQFYPYVEHLYARGIISGYGKSGNFKPDEFLTRAQAAKILAGAAGLKASAGFRSELSDVNKNTDMYESIWALEEAGIVKGFGDSKRFKPQDRIQRGHIAKMIVLTFKLKKGAKAVSFTDLPTDDPEVKEAIQILASLGIVSGYGKSGEFRPANPVTRGQFSKMVSGSLDTVSLKIIDIK